MELYRNLFFHITKGNTMFLYQCVLIFEGTKTNTTIIILSVQTVLMSASCQVDVKSQMTLLPTRSPTFSPRPTYRAVAVD